MTIWITIGKNSKNLKTFEYDLTYDEDLELIVDAVDDLEEDEL